MEEPKMLVENLIVRLGGNITDIEKAALRKLVGAQPASETTGAGVATVAAPAVVTTLALDTRSVKAEVNRDTILCLDFGTAFSKAAATNSTDDLIEIGLGRTAGEEPRLQFPVHSSLYLTGNRIWFGPQAIERSLNDNDPERRRFDSPKQEMSQANWEAIKNQPVARSINPTNEAFTNNELIQLYLAYLTDLATSELTAKGYSAMVLRRFARPCWTEDRAAIANKAFREMLAKGQIVADTLHGSWIDGVPINVARAVLNQTEALSGYPEHLVDRDVLEATAAASGALKGISGQSLVLVVDVGAGTCDFGLFFAVAGLRVAEIRGTSQVLRQAGERLDECLLSAILEAAHLAEESDEARRVRPRLRLRIRDLKEMLFQTGSISATLENDAVANIALHNFVTRADVMGFTKNFEMTLRAALSAAAQGTYGRTNGRVDVVLTGGGANLPMVRDLFMEPLKIDGHDTLVFTVRDAAPEWLNDYPDLVDHFPQLAVAIGGSQHDLPVQVTGVTDIVPPLPGPRFIPPIYKG